MEMFGIISGTNYVVIFVYFLGFIDNFSEVLWTYFTVFKALGSKYNQTCFNRGGISKYYGGL